MLQERKGWPQWKDAYPKQLSFLCLMNITSGVMDNYCIKPRFPVVSWHALCTKADYLGTKEERLLKRKWGLVSGVFLNESWDQLPWQFAFCSVPNPYIRLRILGLKSFSFIVIVNGKSTLPWWGQLEVPGPGCFVKILGLLLSKIGPMPQELGTEPCADRTRHEGSMDEKCYK